MRALLTQAEAAARLRVSVKTLYRLRRAGRLRYIPGKPVRVPAEDIERLIVEGLVRDPAAPAQAGKAKPSMPSAAVRARRALLKRQIRAAAQARRP